MCYAYDTAKRARARSTAGRFASPVAHAGSVWRQIGACALRIAGAVMRFIHHHYGHTSPTPASPSRHPPSPRAYCRPARPPAAAQASQVPRTMEYAARTTTDRGPAWAGTLRPAHWRRHLAAAMHGPRGHWRTGAPGAACLRRPVSLHRPACARYPQKWRFYCPQLAGASALRSRPLSRRTPAAYLQSIHDAMRHTRQGYRRRTGAARKATYVVRNVW